MEMSGGVTVTIAFLDKRNNTHTQPNRMRLAKAVLLPCADGDTDQLIGNLDQESYNLLKCLRHFSQSLSSERIAEDDGADLLIAA